jgi:hypothetical protein
MNAARLQARAWPVIWTTGADLMAGPGGAAGRVGIGSDMDRRFPADR